MTLPSCPAPDARGVATLPLPRRSPTRFTAGPIATVARFTVIEALRSRWGLSTLAIVAIAFAAAVFAGQLALTEQAAVAMAAAAPAVRGMAVALITAFTAHSVVREFADGSALQAFAAPLARSHWVVGKFAGAGLLAAATGLACGLPAAVFATGASPLAVLAWTATLALELVTMAAIALAIAAALRQLPATLLACGGVYLLARVIGAVMLLNERAPIADSERAGQWTSWSLAALAAVLPRFDLYARTDWLLGSAAPAPAPALWQTALYVAIALTVAARDLGRRDA
jgi:ABC-type transport system involved in multi-copper enzyme maturation permease subunit